MTEKNNEKKQDVLKTEIAGKAVTLHFNPEPNPEAADFIKKILVSTYLLKVV